MTSIGRFRDYGYSVKPSYELIAIGFVLILCLPSQASAQRANIVALGPSTVVCSSNDGQQAHCNADTRSGVRLVRQISGSPCQQDSTWGYDSRGIWVDRGCRAEFEASRGASYLQTRRIVAGFSVSVRTHELIDVRNSDGRVFSGAVDEDVIDADGNVVIPRGAAVELLVKNTSNRTLVLDLDSVTVNGQRYAVSEYADRDGGQRDGIGNSVRTETYAVGGALLGTLTGGTDVGGKGAAIGAGAAAGAQFLTQRARVRVPADSLLTYRLEQPLEMGVPDSGVYRQGRHYHSPNR